MFSPRISTDITGAPFQDNLSTVDAPKRFSVFADMDAANSFPLRSLNTIVRSLC
jgi:hypothetical protein